MCVHVLHNEIYNKHWYTKELRKELTTSIEIVSSSTTLFKSILIRICINRPKLKYEKKIIKHHQNKLQNLLDEKNKESNNQANPNSFVNNLSNSH